MGFFYLSLFLSVFLPNLLFSSPNSLSPSPAPSSCPSVAASSFTDFNFATLLALSAFLFHCTEKSLQIWFATNFQHPLSGCVKTVSSFFTLLFGSAALIVALLILHYSYFKYDYYESWNLAQILFLLAVFSIFIYLVLKFFGGWWPTPASVEAQELGEEDNNSSEDDDRQLSVTSTRRYSLSPSLEEGLLWFGRDALSNKEFRVVHRERNIGIRGISNLSSP